MKLIVGLGNPGRDYSGTRHNIGFTVLGALARKHGINFNKRCCQSRVGEGRICCQDVILAKPQTYMNLSGNAVSALMRRYRIKPVDVIVVHDDLDLPLGRIRLREGGSAGGHNGIKSIIDVTGSTGFIRLKIGIGRPENAEENRRDVIDHVLSVFDAADREAAQEVIVRAAEAVESVLTNGPTVAMNRFN